MPCWSACSIRSAPEPAPHQTPQFNCGSRACPRWRCIRRPILSWPTAIAGKPAPTFFALCSSPSTAQPVGAGLARDGGVSDGPFSAGPPLSQASQLPHFLPCVPVQAPHNLWEPGLPAMAVYQMAHSQLAHRYRRQASSHIFCPVFQSRHRTTCGSRACPQWRCIRWHICN